MKANRKNLIAALTKVQPGLSAKEVVEQSNSFVFNDGRVYTYNDEVAVSHPLPKGLKKLSGAVPAKEFFTLLNKINSEQIEFELEHGEIRFSGARSNTGFRLEEEILLPLDELGEPDERTPLPETFAEGVGFCLFSTSTDSSKPILQCVHVNGDIVESSDNFRLTRYDMGDAEGAFETPLLIPSFAARSLARFSPVEYARTQGWAHFWDADDVMFSCRVFEDDFPDIDHFFEDSGDKVKLPIELNDVLDRADVFASGSEGSGRVGVALDKKTATVSAENIVGWFNETTDVRYRGKAVKFEINPAFLKAILKDNDSARIDKNLLKFKGENFQHVVGLMAA